MATLTFLVAARCMIVATATVWASITTCPILFHSSGSAMEEGAPYCSKLNLFYFWLFHMAGHRITPNLIDKTH